MALSIPYIKNNKKPTLDHLVDLQFPSSLQKFDGVKQSSPNSRKNGGEKEVERTCSVNNWSLDPSPLFMSKRPTRHCFPGPILSWGYEVIAPLPGLVINTLKEIAHRCYCLHYKDCSLYQHFKRI